MFLWGLRPPKWPEKVLCDETHWQTLGWGLQSSSLQVHVACWCKGSETPAINEPFNLTESHVSKMYLTSECSCSHSIYERPTEHTLGNAAVDPKLPLLTTLLNWVCPLTHKCEESDLLIFPFSSLNLSQVPKNSPSHLEGSTCLIAPVLLGKHVAATVCPWRRAKNQAVLLWTQIS